MFTVQIPGNRRTYIQLSTIFLSCLIGRMSTYQRACSAANVELLQQARAAVPLLSTDLYKGKAGRIGVVGGSIEYTGAPFFSAISALRTGIDLVKVFCAKEAAIPIKSYSPELMVYPTFDASYTGNPNDQLKVIEPHLEKFDVVVIGPGLGRHETILSAVTELIHRCRAIKKPLILDADATYLISRNFSLIKDYPNAIITPNAYEFKNMFGTDIDFNELGNGVTILKKHANDTILHQSTDEIVVPGGSGRRCGGQGDILTGCTAAFYTWCIKANVPQASRIAAFAGSYMVKRLNEHTFGIKGRSMVAGDMIENIGKVFNDHFETV